MLKGPGRHPYDYPGVGDTVPSALIQEEQNLGWDTPPIGIDGGKDDMGGWILLPAALVRGHIA